MKKLLTMLITCSALLSTSAFAQDTTIANLRPNAAIKDQSPPSTIAKVVNDDKKQQRSYPMQPPMIPHKTRNYEVNLNTNKCMSCHSRQNTQESQAPMVSVTHYMDRDGNFLAEISPRRYFCNQCHVNQYDVKTPVENNFVDMHTLTKRNAQQK